MKLVVVKVGGSLYNEPRLGPGLRAFLNTIDADRILVVAGGGPFAEAVREMGRRHELSDAVGHHLAMTTLAATGELLGHLIGISEFGNLIPWPTIPAGRVAVLQPLWFLTDYEDRFGPVPHTWDLTTDSIAALAARVANARLVLLKSVDIPPGTPWPEAADRGWVDRYFPTAFGNPPVSVEAVNFRRWLDEHFPRPADGGPMDL
ncbi:MAG: hypothetical protein ACRC7O_05710 [Fimbriiglobus sp.]